MRTVSAGILILLFVTACNPTPTPAAPKNAPHSDADTPLTGAAAPSGMNIGTVEESVLTQATIVEADRTEGITVDEQRTYKKDLAMVVVEVIDPGVRELWLTFTTTSSEAFANRPVVARLSVWREVGLGKDTAKKREKIGGKNFVLGATANHARTRDGAPIPQPTYQIDAFGGLETLPESMLIHGEVELLLLPLGTDENQVDPDTATTDARDSVLKPTNPIRINIAHASSTS